MTRSGSLVPFRQWAGLPVLVFGMPMHSERQSSKGIARPAAWRGRDNRVEGVNLGGNRAPARGRNRNSRPEPTPQAALAGFLGPARMAGGSIGLRNCRGWGERASARRSPALSIAQSETGASSGSRGSIATLQASTDVKDGHNLFKVLGYCSQTGVTNDSRCIRPRQRILD